MEMYQDPDMWTHPYMFVVSHVSQHRLPSECDELTCASAKKESLLDVIVSCRKVYHEILSILFEEIIFCFPEFQALDYFHRLYLRIDRLDGLIVPLPQHVVMNGLYFADDSQCRILAGLLDGVRVLEVDTDWIDRYSLWDPLWFSHEENEEGPPVIRELVQLRGIEIRYFPDSELTLAQSKPGAEAVALKELIGQPKTRHDHIQLSEEEKDKAVDQVIERGKQIRAKALHEQELRNAQPPLSSGTSEHEAADHEAAGHETADHETADHQTANHGSSNQ